MSGEGATGIVKRSVVLAGHRTSVSLEDAFWTALGAIARARGVSVNALIGEMEASIREADSFVATLGKEAES